MSTGEAVGPYGPGTLSAVQTEVVGRRREIQLVIAALMAARHLMLEGPPGTGKSTILRAVAKAGGHGFEFIEGNAELTPARLVGHFDPAQVMESGYSPEVWVDGPLARALRDGSLLYLEEINRIPEETLNLLVTVMSEGELTIPRLGRIDASPNFRMVAAMNPFDAVGTARISGAIYDRVCRIGMGYQSEDDEQAIVNRHAPWPNSEFPSRVVSLVRATRNHPEIRVGSSVRGAVDLLLLATDLGTLRGLPPEHHDVGLDAALTALSGRIRLHDSSTTTPEAVITELYRQLVEPDDAEGHIDSNGAPEPGKAKRRQEAATTTTSES